MEEENTEDTVAGAYSLSSQLETNKDIKGCLQPSTLTILGSGRTNTTYLAGGHNTIATKTSIKAGGHVNTHHPNVSTTMNNIATPNLFGQTGSLATGHNEGSLGPNTINTASTGPNIFQR